MGYWHRHIVTLIASLGGIVPGLSQVQITEFQASNVQTILAPDGNFLEWVEIYNSGGSAVDLDGFYLSEDTGVPPECEITGISLDPYQYKVLWLERDAAYLSTEWKLDMDGGTIALISPQGALVDSVNYPPQLVDVSMGITASGDWAYYEEPTPGAANNTFPYNAATRSGNVIFSFPGGLYQEPLHLELSLDNPSGEIRYTIDGSMPDREAHLYAGPINVDRTMVIRARSYLPDSLPGKVQTHSYILFEESAFPVISISTDAAHFFDDRTGIYVEGTNGIPGLCVDYPVNWNMDWERPVNLEYFTRQGDQKINQLVGTKINGNCSRRRDFKSLGIYARKIYGDNSLNYNFFRTKDIDSFKGIVLRNSGSDAYFTMFRDGFMQSLLIGRMDIDYQAFEPATVFLNGEYWGILNIREKVNEHYPASNYDVDSDKIDMLEREYYLLRGEVINGSGEHYADLYEYLDEHDLSVEEHYEYVSSQMDVNEFLNYYIAQIYFKNNDWPGNNVKYWRPHTTGGRWRWVLFDTDHGWGLFPEEGNTFSQATVPAMYTTVINSLLENEGFRNEFIQRMCAHINTTFDPERVIPIYDSIRSYMELELDRHQARWGKPSDYTYGQQADVIMPDFTVERPGVVVREMEEFFDIRGMYALTTDVSDPLMGTIRICEVEMPASISGPYFKNVPVRLQAVPGSGYRFSRWEGDTSSVSSTMFLTSDTDRYIRAVFEPAPPVSQIQINEVSASPGTEGVDDFGESTDWIELRNGNAFSVDLGGWYLSDSAGHADKYMIPVGIPEQTTIGPGELLVIWCDNEPEQGPLHAGFRLRREGEFLTLSQKVGTELSIRDSIRYGELHKDLTYGRSLVSDSWEFLVPTPGAPNSAGQPKQLIINEFMTGNCGSLLDEHGEAEDWIEIYNPTGDTIELAGLFMTDSLGDPLDHMIPAGFEATLVPPGGYLVLWADNQPWQGPLHLGFRLDARSEQIGLYQVGAGFRDSVTYHTGRGGTVLGRYPDGDTTWQWLPPSPGRANIRGGYDQLRINELMASNRSTALDEWGGFDDWIEIYNGNDFPVDIGGLYLTDSLGDPFKHRVPMCRSDSTTVPAFGHLLLWADNREDQGVLHAGFRLNSGGETLAIAGPLGIPYLDTVRFGPLEQDQSYGRLTDGSDNLQPLTATPGEPNAIRYMEHVFINEFMASNRSTAADAYGEYDDWIEIHNTGDQPVDIGGMYVTDSLPDPSRYRIPSYDPDQTTIPAGGYLLLWADNQPDQGILHLGFRLDADGEEIGLVQPDGSTWADSLSFVEMDTDLPAGRLPDGTGPFGYVSATPGNPNKVNELQGIRINEIMASNRTSYSDPLGEYDDWIELYNANDHPVDVGGLFLTDTLGIPAGYRIPSWQPDSTTIPPGGFLVLWADDQPSQGVLHVGFRLDIDGEQVGLVQADGKTYLDSLSYTGLLPDQAFGRLGDGMDNLQLVTASPGSSNFLSPVERLFFSELVASGNELNQDAFGEYDDWIEIHNANGFEVDIGGLFLTDTFTEPMKFRIPTGNPDSTTIAPGGYIVLWADGQPGQGIRHLGFRLNGQGEQLALYKADGADLIDSVSFPDQYRHFSYSRLDDTGEWRFLRPTFSTANLLDPIQGITINEFMASSTSLTDENGEFDDWIELHNANPFPVDLGGLFITDSMDRATRYRIPSHSPEMTTIEANGYYLLFADDQSHQGVHHTNFKLRREGEQIAIFHYDEQTVIDSVTYSSQYRNASFGRLPDMESWHVIPATPMASNDLPDLSGLVINEVMGFNKTIFGDEYNEYEDWIELYNAGSQPVDIGGIYITDSLPDPTRFRISSECPDSTTISPGGYLLLWADNTEEQGVLHLGFRVSKTGDEIALYDYTFNLVDSTFYPFISPNLSWGRQYDGGSAWTIHYQPTPLAANLYTSLDEVPSRSSGSIRIFPNPVTDRAVIVCYVKEPGEVLFEVVDAMGKAVSQKRVHADSKGRMELEWVPQDGTGHKLPSGMYICRVTSGLQQFSCKVTIR